MALALEKAGRLQDVGLTILDERYVQSSFHVWSLFVVLSLCVYIYVHAHTSVCKCIHAYHMYVHMLLGLWILGRLQEGFGNGTELYPMPVLA